MDHRAVSLSSINHSHFPPSHILQIDAEACLNSSFSQGLHFCKFDHLASRELRLHPQSEGCECLQKPA